jgi:DNA-binding NarL/FixJ family response regulator
VQRVVARGLSNRDAAAVLHFSEHTVANHLRSVLRKTGCANRTQATTYADRHEIAET